MRCLPRPRCYVLARGRPYGPGRGAVRHAAEMTAKCRRRPLPSQAWAMRPRRQPSRPPPLPEAAPIRRSLSPSRAGDFLTCPLLYRFRVIDRLPEPPSPAAVRGTLVHAVLEHLFDQPPPGRTPQQARSLLAPQWERLAADDPDLAGLFDDDAERAAWLAGAGEHAGPLLHAGGPAPDRAGSPRTVRGGRPRLRPAAARLHRPPRRGPRRRDPDRGLQDRDRPAGGVRGPGAVPDAVLRAGDLAGPGARCRPCSS